MDKTQIRLTFDKSSREEVLGYVDKSINVDGLIVEKDNPEQKVLSTDGDEVHIDEFGGVQKGSEVFIKKDLISLMRLSKE